MNISGSTVLLTGASGGLGHAIARRLVREGATLILTGRREAELNQLADELDASVVVADLTDPTSIATLIEAASAADILIANAGTGNDVGIRSETAENIDRVIDTNLRSPIHLSVEFAQRLIDEGRTGHIVFVGSLSGLAPTPNTRLYNSTKFGLRGFALAMRHDVAEHGIGVSIVEPSFIATAGMFADNGVQLPRVVRMKSPDDVAAGVVRAIQRNTAESFVSPIELRAVATLAVAAPNLSDRIQRLVDTKSFKPAD
ncbi:MAG: SDR family oxidoreductase [Microthrixaceae bacterium]|nr:SDR family NAD(P)-dependent oxidoreductase [Microthrixaceae bacterium]MCO5311574.1 SDR family oxidoreductase [Microthrixaceae bacterium]HPB44711.1 SDR family NAD(P)-dependent oxidoreductase [Microthrixaceae bacterium]